jgi:hypothetical protein
MATRPRSARLLTAAAALALASAAPAAAQRIDPNRVIDLSVSTPSGVLTSTVREGGSLRLVLAHTDEYVMMPRAADRAGTKVLLTVYRGTAEQPATRRVVETVELRKGTAVRLRSNAAIQVVVDAVRHSPPTAQAAATTRPVSFRPAALLRAAFQNDQCCVACGPDVACACGVRMWCGSCCMPGCCQPLGTGEPVVEQFAQFLGVGCGSFAPATRTGAIAMR